MGDDKSSSREKTDSRKTESKNRLIGTLTAVGVGAGLLAFSRLLRGEDFFVTQMVTFAGLGSLLVSVASSSLGYLSGASRDRPSLSVKGIQNSEEARHEIDFLSSQLTELKASITALSDNPRVPILTVDERSAALQAFKQRIESETTDAVLEELRAEAQKRPPVDLSEIRLRQRESRARLESEISALSRRGNLNLVIGIVTTIVAISTLAYIAIFGNPGNEEVPKIILHYVPRFSVAVFIEVFSFFFLRLYRNGLEDIKYFQNELTNIELRSMGLETAVLTLDTQVIAAAANSLASTERNFRLNKGESTVDLEKAKIESRGDHDLFERLLKVASASK